MRFTYSMLLELIGQTWCTVAAHRSAKAEGFTSVRLLGALDEGAYDEETLFVTDAATLAQRPADAMPLAMCICARSLDSISAVVSGLCEDVSWVAVDAPDLAALLNKLLDRFSSLQTWEENMSQLIQHDGSLQELLDMSEDVLKLPVTICGPLFDSFLCTSHLRSDDPFFLEAAEKGYLDTESVAKLERAGVFSSPADDRHVKVFPPSELLDIWHMNRHFWEHGERAFFVTAMCADGKPTPGTIELFDLLARKLFELYRAKRGAGGTALGSQELVLKFLLSDTEITRDRIENSFGVIRRSTEGVWRLVVLEFKDPLAAPRAYQANMFLKRFSDALICLFDEKIVLLAQSELFDSRAVAELTVFAKSQGGYVGLSSLFTDVADAQTAFRQACFAIRMGQKVSSEKVLKRQLGIAKEYPSACFYFDDYLLHELLDHYPLGTRGVNPGRRPAFALVEHDKANGTQKALFLYTYLSCNCSTGETARVLGMHRNSVGYQVKSIEALLGVDIHDVDFICHTRIAFTSMEVFGL